MKTKGIRTASGRAMVMAAACLVMMHATDAAACDDEINPDARVVFNGFGGDPFNTRKQASALRSENVGHLVPALVHGDTEASERRGTPVVTTQAIFATLKFHVAAINRTTGCEYWRYSPFGADADPIRNGFRSIYLLSEGNGNPAILYAGDRNGYVHAIDTRSGKLIWKRFLGTDQDNHMITGTAIAGGGRLFVPVSTIEVARTVFVDDICCRSHGLVQAVHPYTGDAIWTFHVTEDAKPQPGNPNRLGPNGGSVWGSPALDAESKTLFVGTGQNLTQPATATSDALIALDTETGKIKWSFQTTANDAWNISCQLPALWGKEAKCDRPEGGDFDIGAAPLLTALPGNKPVVVAGAKSGVVYVLDRTTGALVWSRRLGAGGNLGGIHWGMASDGERIYVGVSDLNVQKQTIFDRPGKPAKQVVSKNGRPGVYALDLRDGSVAWEAHPTRDHEGKPVPAIFSAALSVTNDVLFAGALNGMLYAFNTKDGTMLWSSDASTSPARLAPARPGVQGGTIDGAGPIVAGNDLFVNSGYSTFGGANRFHAGPGNALIVYKLPGQ
ncbi:outer membrane protein assembly factor BamB family protein [Noviherbaspirillum galbum]|uniref:PQQ-binding-like beta-propeller repeat protein n=1 Tax=Noviherbaspirillum galbum TaxID=2709383 RepID=A0A6B3SM89_9BURK|nr:PQQ-binding-like beta-propeller repeat protein [Noviherbaspirillum galbum]NEX61950.1 PQQ-binding-like beta-propeller repeat protein [Noviherbaspirillum galbum]